MVTCRRCGKQGWRYEMEVAYGMWYCQLCYAGVEKTLSPASAQADHELLQFLELRRAYLEFARYLVIVGKLGEELADDEDSAKREPDQERAVGR